MGRSPHGRAAAPVARGACRAERAGDRGRPAAHGLRSRASGRRRRGRRATAAVLSRDPRLMLEFLTLGELAVALLMGLAALCAFVWGAASGALGDVENAKHQVLRAEREHDDA